jgi:nucleoside-diphosphate-sugar epimerase
MTSARIVVLGASGFVGTTLAERLLRKPQVEVVPVIHSAGSAWRLARHHIGLVVADVADRASLAQALRGATHVVNCTRGPREIMIDGLRNILACCREAHVQRFVHLSSVMVYGDPPHPDSRRESAPANPPPGTSSYGMIKLEQDRMVEAAARAGLPSVVLCPPNISGPFSGYVVGIVNALRSGAFALADDGEGPCNLVDVRNLCHAVELALGTTNGAALDGSRMFVTDAEPVRWKEVVAELSELAGSREPRRIERTRLRALVDAGDAGPRASLRRSIRHLVSSDVRAALRKDPLLARLDAALRSAVAKLGPAIESRLRLGIEGPPPVERPNPYAGLALGLCAQQLRNVRHENTRAQSILGYQPIVSFGRGMADFRAWYRIMHGMDAPCWSIAQRLYE